MSRVHPVRLPPKTRKSPATMTPTIRRPLRWSRIQPAERRTRLDSAAARPAPEVTCPVLRRHPAPAAGAGLADPHRVAGRPGQPAAEGDQHRNQYRPAQVRLQEAQHGVPDGGGTLRLEAPPGGLADENATSDRQDPQQQEGHQRHAHGQTHQRLATLHGQSHRQDRQHQADDRNEPLELHDQVEEPREVGDLLPRDHGEVHAVGRQRAERVEDRDAAGVRGPRSPG